jgi:hypothetical protein
MVTHAPVHPSANSSAATTAATSSVRTVVLTVGGVALWMALVLGMQWVNQHSFGLAELDAWALAIAVVSYIAIFIGFMVGVISLVLRADRLQEQRER